jgi:uncharacterized membrane protein
MAFCATCGAPVVEGRFCAKCGSSVAGGPAAGPGAPAAGGLTDNVASALCYVLTFITGILFLVIEPYSKNRVVRFHAFQAIFLGVGMIVVNIALSIVAIVLAMIHLGVLTLIFPLIYLGELVLLIYMIFAAYQGKTIVLPIIGPLAQKQA